MNIHRASPVLALWMSGTLAACAASPALSLESLLSERGYTIGHSVESISNYSLSGFSALDDQHLVLDTGPSSRYLITLQTLCIGMRSAERIGVTATPSSRLTKFDKVIVEDVAVDQHCPISNIQMLDRIPRDAAS